VVLVERGRAEDLQQRDFRITARDADTGTFLGGLEPPNANDAELGTVGVGPEGERLVPTTGSAGQVVLVLEARRG
jgi:hypothetical protein